MRYATLEAIEGRLMTLYQGRVSCTLRHHSHEWALIAALDGAEIPIKCRVVRPEKVKPPQWAWNQQIYDAGLKTQIYDKGFERFVRKISPEVEMSATLAIVKGAHHEHGTAVYLTQETRRCLLLDTTHCLSDEALWYTLQSWASFQPRLKNPRETPGRLFYPSEFSHVFEKYSVNIDCPLNHPEFSQESPFTHECMKLYRTALSSLNCADFTPQVHAEAKDSDVRIATDATTSRLLPILDGPGLWAIIGDRSSPVTVF
jgi:hypothetical protein